MQDIRKGCKLQKQSAGLPIGGKQYRVYSEERKRKEMQGKIQRVQNEIIDQLAD